MNTRSIITNGSVIFHGGLNIDLISAPKYVQIRFVLQTCPYMKNTQNIAVFDRQTYRISITN